MKMLEEITSAESRPVFRQQHLDEALGNATLEGLRPTPAALADLQRVVDGSLTEEEYLARLKRRY